MNLENIVSSYGYIGVLIGTLIEGETVLILAGFLARMNYLNLLWVIIAAFIGAFIGDQLFFYLGRFKGIQLLKKRPRWKARSEKVLRILKRHQILVIFGFRFLYGLRIITPFVLGVSGVRPMRFLALDIIAVGLWSVSIGTAGYLLGQTLQAFMGKIKQYELWIIGGIVAIGFILWLGYLWIGLKNKPTDDTLSL